MGAVMRQIAAVASGFKRIQETDSNFSYPNGSNVEYQPYYDGGSAKYWLNSTGVVKFNFVGSKLIINADVYINKANNIKIIIDDYIVDTYSEYASVSYVIGTVYEKLDLKYKEHSVEIYCNALATGFNWNFDSIDIDATGYLKPYKKLSYYLIKSNTNYYSTNPAYYNTTSKTYSPLALSGGTIPNSADIRAYGCDNISDLLTFTTINGETFLPEDKMFSLYSIKRYNPK